MDYVRRSVFGAWVALATLVTASCVGPKPDAMTAATLPPQPLEVAAIAAPKVAQPPLIAEALAALDAHAGRVPRRDRIGVVDFSKPSSEPRLYLVDVATGRIERSFLVAHGAGSDPQRTGMVQRFSNMPGSNASSLGAYVTAGEYVGKHGPSERLVGLDPDNDMALERAIVIHGADYVDPAMAATQGRIGRSQGCFAVAPSEVATVIALLGEGRMIYAGKPA